MVDQDTVLDLEAVNQALATTGQPFKLAIVPIEQLTLLDKNARYMPHEMFKNLVENIKRDNGLSSVPFCWFDGNTYHVLSGNHRVKAAQAAGLTHILILYDDRPLADANLAFLSEARLDFRVLTFLFLPEEVEGLKSSFQRAAETLVADEVLAMRLSEFGRAIDALDKAKASFNVHNAATAMLMVLSVFEDHLEDLPAGWVGPEKPKHTGRVPLASVFGTDKVPAKTALVLKQALDRMLAKGEVEKKDSAKALELMAHKYLSVE